MRKLVILMLVLVFLVPSVSAIATSNDYGNLTLLYHLNEAAGSLLIDSADNYPLNYSMNVVNGEDTDWVSGVYGNARHFDGSDECANETRSDWNPTNTVQTFAMWLKVNSTPDDWDRVFSFAELGVNDDMMECRWDNSPTNYLDCRYLDAGGAKWDTPALANLTFQHFNEWSSLIITSDLTKVTIYLNKTEIISLSYAGNLTNTVNSLSIGCQCYTSGGTSSCVEHADIMVDEFSLYNMTFDQHLVDWFVDGNLTTDISITDVIFTSSDPDDGVETYDSGGDDTPIFNVTTDLAATCGISLTNHTFVDCGTTGGLVSICTSPTLDLGADIIYVNCTGTSGVPDWDELEVYNNRQPSCEFVANETTVYGDDVFDVTANWSDSSLDDSGSIAIMWYINGTLIETHNRSVTANSTHDFNLSATNLTKDSLVIPACVVTDNSSINGSPSTTYNYFTNHSTVTISNIHPIMSLSEPVSGLRYNGNFTFNWTGSDGDGETPTWNLTVNGSLFFTGTTFGLEVFTANFSDGDGTYYWNVSGSDANNTNKSGSWDVVVDSTPAVVSSLLNHSADTSTFNISWTCDELCNYTLLYDSDNSSLDLSTSSSVLTDSFNIEVTGLTADTTYYWELYVYDNVTSTPNGAVSAIFDVATTSSGDGDDGGGGGGGGGSRDTTIILGNFSVVPSRIGSFVILNPLFDMDFSRVLSSVRDISGCDTGFVECTISDDKLSVGLFKEFSGVEGFSEKFTDTVVLTSGKESVKVPVEITVIDLTQFVKVDLDVPAVISFNWLFHKSNGRVDGVFIFSVVALVLLVMLAFAVGGSSDIMVFKRTK